MLTVKGKSDGRVVRLEREVPVQGEVEVLVEFPDGQPHGEGVESARDDLVDFLLNGPTLSEDEIASIEEGMKELRQWRR